MSLALASETAATSASSSLYAMDAAAAAAFGSGVRHRAAAIPTAEWVADTYLCSKIHRKLREPAAMNE